MHNMKCYSSSSNQSRRSETGEKMRILLQPRLRRTAKLLILLILVGISIIAFNMLYYIPANGPSRIKLRITPPVIEPAVGPEAIFLLILVTSKPSSFSRRELFRRTMGTLENKPTSRWKMFFNLGRGSTYDDDVKKEASKHNDILVGNFKDTYDNLIFKTFTAFQWAAKNVKSEFVLKADDDVYVHFPRMIAWLKSENSSRSLYAGMLAVGTHVDRSPWEPYFISYKTYAGIENGALFHPYCRGPFYVLSHNLLGPLWNATKAHEPFAIEDAYVGVVLNSIGILPRRLPRCRWNLTSQWKFHTMDDCFYRDAICVGHMLDNTLINYAHERFNNQTKTLSECEREKSKKFLHHVLY